MLMPGGLNPFDHGPGWWWRHLRGMRAQPPGAAARDATRRATFNAALEQAEQMFRAAEGAGVMTRPILAFYGLSQAGRAIAAAAASVPDHVQAPGQSAVPWKLSGHGIRVPGISTAAASGELASIPLSDHGSGAFTQLAEILNSGSLIARKPDGLEAQKVTMTELWRTLPDTLGFNLKELPLYPVLGFSETAPGTLPRYVATLSADIEGIPRRVHDANDQQAALKEFLAHYPTVGDWDFVPGVPLATQWSKANFTGLHIVKLVWRQLTGLPAGPQGSDVLAKQVATQYFRDWYLLPALGDNSKPLHPLLTWWAILYALSMLARYEPYAWGKMTAIDTSVEASAIEHLLEVGIARLPELILDTIDEVSAP